MNCFIKKLTLFLVLYCSISSCFASIDSLKKAIVQYESSKNIESFASASIYLSEILIEENRYDEALANINNLIRKIDTSNVTLTSRAISCKAVINFFHYRNIDSANLYLDQSYNLVKEAKSSEKHFYYNLNKAYVLSHNGNSNEALSILEHIIDQIPSAAQYYKVRAYRLLKRCYQHKGDYDKAISATRNALDLCKSNNDFRNLAHLYNDLGSIFHDLQNYDQAILNYENAIQNAQKSNFKRLEGISLSNIGAIYANQGKIKESGIVLNEALTIKEELKDSAGIAQVLFYLNEQYVQNNEFDKALESAQRIIKYYESQPDQKIMLSYVYLHASSYANELNNPSEAKVYAKKCMQLAEELNSKELVKYSYETLYSINKSTHNYAEALENYENFFVMHDSIYTESSQKALEEERVKQEVEAAQAAREKAELQTKLLGQKQRIKNQWFLIAGILSTLLMTVIILRSRYRIKLEKRLAVEKLRHKISHDLHDDVGSILTGLAMQTEIMEAQASLEQKTKLNKISNLSRSAMSHMRDAVWAMDSEKDNWQSLIDRMNEFALETLTPKNIEFKFNHSTSLKNQNIKTEIRQNLYLIFKEGLTNIIKHSNGDKVIVSLEENNLSIWDNGQAKSKTYKTTGFGLSSMEKRASLINGSLAINQKDGFEIIVKL